MFATPQLYLKLNAWLSAVPTLLPGECKLLVLSAGPDWIVEAEIRVKTKVFLDLRHSLWNKYCFLVLGFLHGVRSEFTDNGLGAAVGPIFIGHELQYK